MALIDQTTLANNATFQARIRAACIQSAIAVMEDAQETDPKRTALARYVLTQPDQVAPRVASVAAALGATEAATDATIQAAVDTRWTTLAKLLIYPVLLLCLWATTAGAQMRTIPSLSASGPFAAGSHEVGAAGEFVIVPLRDTLTQAPSVVKRYDDLLFYAPTQPGPYLLVVSIVNPYGSGSVLDCYQWVWLPPGLTLTAAYLDNDDRQDVLGRDAATGALFRWYRRGPQTAGCW